MRDSKEIRSAYIHSPSSFAQLSHSVSAPKMRTAEISSLEIINSCFSYLHLWLSTHLSRWYNSSSLVPSFPLYHLCLSIPCKSRYHPDIVTAAFRAWYQFQWFHLDRFDRKAVWPFEALYNSLDFSRRLGNECHIRRPSDQRVAQIWKQRRAEKLFRTRKCFQSELSRLENPTFFLCLSWGSICYSHHIY